MLNVCDCSLAVSPMRAHLLQDPWLSGPASQQVWQFKYKI